MGEEAFLKRSQGGSFSKHIAKGCLPIYIGIEEQVRFIVRIEYLYHPLFKDLLQKAEEVYGFEQKGPLRIPCKVEKFNELMHAIQEDENRNNGRCLC
ncbi:hypothetical protein SUGI_1035720 [Cryptomeria japonica]|nr:hypothetical protein SUGI_1035720 [Cryptomeria japonica]